MTSKNKQNAKNTFSKTEYKTSSLKDVLTLQESANELSRLTLQTYTAIDILDLALDGKLQPHIDFKKPALAMQLKKVDKTYGLLGVPVSDQQVLVEPDFDEPQYLTYIKDITGMFIFTGLGATALGERYFGYAKDYLENLIASIEGKPRPARSSFSTPIFLDKSGIFYTLVEKADEDFYAPHCDIPSTAVLYFKSSELAAQAALATPTNLQQVVIETTNKEDLKDALFASKESQLLLSYARFGGSVTKNHNQQYKFTKIKDFMEKSDHEPMPSSDNTVRLHLTIALDGYDRRVKASESLPKEISDLGLWQGLVRQ